MVGGVLNRVRLNEWEMQGEEGEGTWPKMPHQKLRGNEVFVFLDRITTGDAGPLKWLATWRRRWAMWLERGALGR